MIGFSGKCKGEFQHSQIADVGMARLVLPDYGHGDTLRCDRQEPGEHGAASKLSKINS
jgi:hypothetical protein